VKTLIFDLETANNPDAVEGGWDNKKALGISTGAAWVSWHQRYMMFRAERIKHLCELIEEADIVVGFNSIGFDEPLLVSQGHSPTIKQHVDLMRLAERPHRKYVGLDELCWHTLGRGKSGNGKHAPELAQLGRWDELYEYNADDVHLTRMLFDFAARWGYVHDKAERIPMQAPGGVEPWRPPPSREKRKHNYDAATPKQIEYLQKLWASRGMTEWHPPQGYTKGQASRDIERMVQG